MKVREREVPCGDCTLCCRNWDMLRLLPGDDPKEYEVVPHPRDMAQFMLKHQDNGDCIYLDREKGCTIHDRRPLMCREMDCRVFFNTVTKKAAQEMRIAGVWDRGRELVRAQQKGSE